MEIIGAVLILGGSLFLFLAALGLVRMPDLYNRMQAGTKATTLGSLLVFLGFIFLMSENWPKIVILALCVLLTNPLSSHALARAARNRGIPAELGPDKKPLPTSELEGGDDL
jgi:multicomponent Na+:H+ antiporter subunit G